MNNATFMALLWMGGGVLLTLLIVNGRLRRGTGVSRAQRLPDRLARARWLAWPGMVMAALAFALNTFLVPPVGGTALNTLVGVLLVAGCLLMVLSLPLIAASVVLGLVLRTRRRRPVVRAGRLFTASGRLLGAFGIAAGKLVVASAAAAAPLVEEDKKDSYTEYGDYCDPYGRSSTTGGVYFNDVTRRWE